MTFSIEDFITPDKRFWPFVRWWWPGLAVKKDQITKELDILEKAGFGGVEIQPFLIGGTGGKQSEKCHRMMPNPYYYEILVHLLKEAKKRDMKVDLTMGSSWPPGSTSINEHNNLKTLLSGCTLIKGNQKVKMKIPPIQLNAYYKYEKMMKMIMGNVQHDFKKFKPKFKMVATVAVKPASWRTSRKFNFIFPQATALDVESVVDITNKVDEDGYLNWDVPESSKDKWYIFSFYGGPTGMTPMSDAKSSKDQRSLVADILNSSSVDILINELIGKNSQKFGELKPFLGETLRAIFTDSQEIADEWFWTQNFFDFFQERREYNIRQYLPACFVPNRDNQFLEVFFQNEKPCYDFHKDSIGERIRRDWLKTLTELWNQEYIKHISDRGEKFGIQHRIQTYGMPVDLLSTFGAADIPETETLFSGSIDFFKMASSAAIIHKKSIVSSETFSWMRKDLTLNPIKWKAACDRLFVAGINQNVFHGWTYEEGHGRNLYNMSFEEGQKDYPGHYPWAGHGFSNNLTDKSLYWSHYKKLNTYVSRLQYLMRGGQIQTNVAIYNNQWNYTYKHLTGEDLEEGNLPGYDSGKIKGAIPWFMRRIRSNVDKKIHLQQKIGHSLMKAGFWYIHVNDEALKKSDVKKGNLLIGNTQIKILIFPDIECLPIEVVEKLEKFAENGVKILFINKIPQYTSGFLDYEENDKKMEEFFQEQLNITQKKNVILYREKKKSQSIEELGKLLKIQMDLSPPILFKKDQEDLTYIWRKYDQYAVIFFRYGKDNNNSVTIDFNQTYFNGWEEKFVYELDPWSGGILPRKFKTNTKKEIEISLNFTPYGSKTIIISQHKIEEGQEQKSPNFLEISLRNTKKQDFIDLNEDWDLIIYHRLPQNKVQEKKMHLETLIDWRGAKQIRYCSGPGYYKKKIEITDVNKEKYRYILNLGKVHDVAKIKLNGTKLGERIVPPYIEDISNQIIEGTNLLEIEVTGTLQNRLIGFAKQFEEEWSKYKKRRLMPIGLIGPVKIEIYPKN